MFHRKIAAFLATMAVAGGMTLAAAPASAGNVAWSVSVGGPGFVVSAGAPAFRGGHWGYGRVGYGRPFVPAARPFFRPFYPAPIVVPAPVLFPAPVVYPVPAFGPRRVAVPAPVWGFGAY
jgi:hypothetical protein